MFRHFTKRFLSNQRIQLQEIDASSIVYTPPQQPEPLSKSNIDPLKTDLVSVYGLISETLKDPELADKQNKRLLGLQNIEHRNNAIFNSKQALESGYVFPVLVKEHELKRLENEKREPGFTFEEDTRLETPFEAFMCRLRKDGGEKIVEYEYNLLHVSADRFVPIIEDIKGLSLNEALLSLKFHQNPTGDHFLSILQESIIIAKERNLDLQKTYIAYALSEKSLQNFSEKFIKTYVRGVGKYGVSPNPTGCLVKLVLQEREKPFSTRQNDPLEWLRRKLRLTQVEHTPTANEVYNLKRSKRPVKAIYC